MSMNNVEEDMARFESALNIFNEKLSVSIQQIEQAHDVIDSSWNDNMRHSYDEQWLPLYEKLKEYDNLIGPQYIELMVTRLQYLRRYLNGD